MLNSYNHAHLENLQMILTDVIQLLKAFVNYWCVIRVRLGTGLVVWVGLRVG